MPTQAEIKRVAKKKGVSPKEMSQRVFGRMRKLGWRPRTAGGPTKAWKARTK